MVTINHTSEQSAQIDQLKNYVEDYCQQNGIDPKMYTSYLDNKNAALDPSIINDPIFQAYWQLSHLQLTEIINPIPLQSLSSEVGDVDLDKLYSTVDLNTQSLLEQIVGSDPSLAGISSQLNMESPQEVLKYLNDSTPPPEAKAYAKEGGVKKVEKTQVGAGGLFDWLEGTQDGLESVEKWAMGGLADIDAYIASLQEMIETGKIDPQKADILSKEAIASRETYVLFMQQSQGRLNQIMDLFSALLKSIRDTQNSVARNYSAPA